VYGENIVIDPFYKIYVPSLCLGIKEEEQKTKLQVKYSSSHLATYNQIGPSEQTHTAGNDGSARQMGPIISTLPVFVFVWSH